MKKIFTLILIFSLTMQIFASEDTVGKGIGDISTTLKYESQKATVLAPFLLNFFLTLGIGSFVQGDYIGGGAVLGTQVLGGILCITGAIFSRIQDAAIAGFILTGIGGLTIAGSYITSLIIPFTFANKYNANLRKKLGISLAGFEPNFDLGINGFQLSFKKSY
ncbi:membrane protein P13 (plasmid) [Borreliella afzelii ACA-1]|uniref:P13 family porin n=2 Tax=Borreliella afzelii TaxID=29518 RepID=UPI00016B2C33|nr:membrane protein P13 [Borreliella afzelii ACA-1]